MTATLRNIVQIDEAKCNGCGLCVDACHEGAIVMENGKARLITESYCDGLGDCLGPCPTGALSIVRRSAEAYDEVAVARHMATRETGETARAPSDSGAACPSPEPVKDSGTAPPPLPCGCPGIMSRSLKGTTAPAPGRLTRDASQTNQSELLNWPVQLRLVPPGAPSLAGADILLAADCAGPAVPDFHRRYLRNRPLIIACPKLDDVGIGTAKLADIIRTARPASVAVLRMEVPCCGGLVRMAVDAVARAGFAVPVESIVVGVDGSEKERRQER